MTYYRFTSPDDPAAEPWGSCEVFYVDAQYVETYWRDHYDTDTFCIPFDADLGTVAVVYDNPTPLVGWYWQPCFPGCMPDGEPVGPFETEADAMADAGCADV